MMSKLLLTLVLSFMQMAAGGASTERILAAFDGRGVPLTWYAVNDDVMGGRSSGDFEIAAGCLLFRGETNTNGGGFASIRTRPQALDIAPHDGVRLTVRGDGRTYQFRLMTAESDIAYRAEFQTQASQWLTVELSFSEFRPSWRGRILDRPPIEPAAITSIGFMIADKRDGPFALEVESITLSPID
jgi:monofunctional biosynthetic peptidoglycan transglycosylase